MGDLTTLAKARRELEDLYLGVPDESVNLTFEDLANVKQHVAAASLEKKRNGSTTNTTMMEPIQEANITNSSLNKLPSIDFSRAMQQTSNYNHHHHQHQHQQQPHHLDHHRYDVNGGEIYHSHHANNASPKRHSGFKHAVEEHSMMSYDDGMSVNSTSPYQQQHHHHHHHDRGEGGGERRRPGIPHSNICTICSTYIYIFRHRCLVCGRVYCRNCVSVGMGEMTEGRKCAECLGRRFSQRYIQRAGKVGCCSRYPSMVKQQELKWAEKGPRRSGERGYNRSVMMSRSRSPVALTPRIPTRAAHASTTNTPPSPSFVMNSPYSAYSPTNHPIPF